MFGVIFFRLWYLQVLTGEQYVQQARINDQRKLPIAAPRGEILDRTGTPIVTNSVTNAVQILPSALPVVVKEEAATYQKAVARAQDQICTRQGTVESLRGGPALLQAPCQRR